MTINTALLPDDWSKEKVNGKSIRVLIVDDLPQVRESLGVILKLSASRTGTRVEVIGEAKNGLEAVQCTQLLNPDVVLMDLEMPILDGYEATRRIKSSWPATRVIILSIHGGLQEQQRAKEAGADCFVVKGDRYEVLLNAILAINGSVDPNEPQEGEGHE